MRIFVISIASAAERRAAAARQLNAAGLDFEFLDAIERVADAFRHFDGFDRRLYELNTGRVPLPGEIGCYASHKMLWNRCAELDEPIVILEDDFLLADDFAAALRNVDSLIHAFGFIRLQSCGSDRRRLGRGPRSTRVSSGRSCALRYLNNVPLCCLAYAISPSAAAALASNSGVLGSPVDKYMQKTWQHSTPIFALEKPIVSASELAVDSTIGVRQDKCRNFGLLVRRLAYKSFGAYRRMLFNRAQINRLAVEGFASDQRLNESAQHTTVIQEST